MPVELNIVESATTLDTTVVEVILTSASEPGPAGPGVPTGGTAGQVLTKDSGTDYDTSWQDATGGGGGAPTDVDYLVGTASGTLSAEIVVGTAPGGELGGTWASPTVDATHSGSSHASVQAAAEATAAAALAAHEADTTGIHGIANTASLETTAGAQAKVDTHVTDATAAHAASAISVDSTTLVGTGTDAQAVFEELDNAVAAAYTPGGTDVSLADGGTGASLADPNGDRIMFWDDSAGAVTWLTAGTNLTITGTTIDASGGGGSTAADDESLILHMAVFA